MRILSGIGFAGAIASAGLSIAPLRAQAGGSGNSDPGSAVQMIFLSGTVALDDGSPLTGPVLIESVCNGNSRPAGHTDSRGSFSIRLGETRAAFNDPSSRATTTPTATRSGSAQINAVDTGTVGSGASGGVRESSLWSCSIRAQLSGYRSDSIALAGRRGGDNPNVGTIVLHRLSNVEGFTTSATAAMASKDAQKAYQKGVEAAKKGNADEAQKNFQKAVELYPHYASAWMDLGRIHEYREHLADARNAYQQALASDPKFASPLERLYLLAAKENKWPEVAELTAKLVRMNSFEFPGAWYYNAVANLQLDKLDAAEKSAREALKVDPEGKNPRINYVLGAVLGMKRDFKGAAQYLAAYVKAAPEAKDIAMARQQLAEAEKLVASGAK